MHNGEWLTGSGCALLVGITGIAKPHYVQCKGFQEWEMRSSPNKEAQRSRKSAKKNNKKKEKHQKTHPKRCIFPLQLTVLRDRHAAGAKSSKLSTCLHGRNARPAAPLPSLNLIFSSFSPLSGLLFFQPKQPTAHCCGTLPRGSVVGILLLGCREKTRGGELSPVPLCCTLRVVGFVPCLIPPLMQDKAVPSGHRVGVSSLPSSGELHRGAVTP